MKKYQLHSLRPKIDGYAYPEPEGEEVRKCLEVRNSGQWSR